MTSRDHSSGKEESEDSTSRTDKAILLISLILLVLGVVIFIGGWFFIVEPALSPPGDGTSAKLVCDPYNGDTKTVIDVQNVSSANRDVLRKALVGDEIVELNRSQEEYFRKHSYVRYDGEVYECEVIFY